MVRAQTALRWLAECCSLQSSRILWLPCPALMSSLPLLEPAAMEPPRVPAGDPTLLPKAR
ncbi:hypothetical protein M9458_049551, partial [Cirrhinus mrigala]